MMSIIAIQIKDKLNLKRAPLNFFTSLGLRIFDVDQILALRKQEITSTKKDSEPIILFCQENPIFKRDNLITERSVATDFRGKPLL